MQISAILGKQDKVALYNKTYMALAAEFHSTWYNATTGGYDTNSQTANSLALGLPFVTPDNLRASVAKVIAADVTTKGHLTAGIIGVSELFIQLSTNGHHDVAVALASNKDYPGWGWTFNNEYENATTVWENFDAGRNPDFASHNHHMFSPIASWFYRCIGGVQLNGLEGIVVHPRLQHDHSLLSSVHIELQTSKGMVASSWESEWAQQRLQLNVTVPNNAHATLVVEVPHKSGRWQQLRVNGQDMLHSPSMGKERMRRRQLSLDGVSGWREMDDGAMELSVSSGVYLFDGMWLL